MARAEIRMPETFLDKLAALGERSDEIIPKVLDAGAEIAYQKVKSNLSDVIGKTVKGKERSTGELLQELGVSPIKVDRKGVYNVKIGFSEPRSDGKSNAMIANVLEYGKHGQPPKPFLKPAKSWCRPACKKAMINKLLSEMSDI